MVSRQNSLSARFTDAPIRIEGGQIDIHPQSDGSLFARISIQGEGRALRAHILTVPYPSALRNLVDSEDHLGLVLVERIPAGLKDVVQELEVNCLDLHGRGRVVEPGFVYLAWPSPEFGIPPKRSKSSPFAVKSSRIVRALLSNPTKRWRLSDIAAQVGLNPGNVHRGLNTLVDDGYVERDGDLYVVADPGSLLETWADVARLPTQKIVIPFQGEIGVATEQIMQDLGPGSTLSGELAAELIAPHLPAKSSQIHCSDAEAWASLEHRGEKDLKSVLSLGPPSGMISVYLSDAGTSQFGSEVSGFSVVSPAQLFVDLYRSRNRGRQAAEEVRRRLLGF